MKNKIKEKINIKNILIALIVGCLFIATTGIGWGYFSSTVTGNDSAKSYTTTTGTLSITYDGGNELIAENVLPGWSATKTFTVENTGDSSVSYNINWLKIKNTFKTKSDILISVTSTNSGGTLSETQVSPSGQHMAIISNATIAPNKKQTYTLTLKYLNRNADQSSDQGSTINGKIEVVDTNEAPGAEPASFKDDCTDEPNRLNCKLIANNTPGEPATTPGSVISETDEGLISGEQDDDGETLYFRGNVQDNYVSFAGKTWRVMRINGDGSVRMILNGATGTNATWNNETDSTYNNTYKTDSHDTMVSWLTYSNSPLKTNIETWYSNNIGNNSDYFDKVATSKYCSDLTHTGTSKGTGIGTYKRKSAPTFKCPSSYTYSLNVATLNADEVIFAGSKYGIANNSYYLYTDSWYWTMSPSYWHSTASVFAFPVISDGTLNYGHYVNNSGGVRPVISLKSGTLINNVSNENIGTSSNPYLVS